MWRVQGFVGRVLQRCHGSSSLRLQNHVEDEVLSSSAVRSRKTDSSSQRDEDGERRRRTFRFSSDLPRYTALDAVGWGAAAVLFMQICRRIHSRFSVAPEPSPAVTGPSRRQTCGYRILLEILSRRDVLPRGSTVLCLKEAAERQNQTSSASASSSEQDHLTAGGSISGQQGAPQDQDPCLTEESFPSASCHQHNETNRDDGEKKDDEDVSSEEKLEAAAQSLRHVADGSVPVVLNIIGLESAKTQDYEQALTCFLAAAHLGYSKAQFNTGVCYEKGRGVGKDQDKALHYYRLAADGGHTQAQYRYAKLLLTSRGQHSAEQVDTAVRLMERAAAGGVTKAQLFMASLCSQNPNSHRTRSVRFLQMAAESGDASALLLAQCYESGFGVQRDERMAAGLCQRSVQSGSRREKRTPTVRRDSVLRSIRSAPCFSSSDQWIQTLSRPPSALPLLPHSWSTGSLCPPNMSSPLSSPLSPTLSSSQWTVGVG